MISKTYLICNVLPLPIRIMLQLKGSIFLVVFCGQNVMHLSNKKDFLQIELARPSTRATRIPTQFIGCCCMYHKLMLKIFI
jgi:hypothetical protein